MAIQELSLSEIESLVGTRHAVTGVEYPANGLQPYYRWLVSALHLLAEASAGAVRVGRDDANETTVRVSPGRATLNGIILVFAGEERDLAIFNNDTAYVWLYDDGGVASVGVGASGGGWPVFAHIKLAEVILASGGIVEILDRRHETIVRGGVDPGVGGVLVRYSLEQIVQGDVGSYSTVKVSALDLLDNPVAEEAYLRVRVCDQGGYGVAANATIAGSGGTAVVETIVAGKDLVVKSDAGGVFHLDVADAVAETVTVRVGAGVVSSMRGDYSSVLDITHA